MLEYFSAMERLKLQVQSGTKKLNVTVISPIKENLAPKPALVLTVGASREYTLYEHAGNRAFIQMMVEAGHRVLSFDLPQHGERIDHHGAEIEGIREAFLAGKSPFASFIEEAIDVFDHCVRLGLGEDRNLLVSGISRGAYFALRLFAVDPRIQAAAIFSPVTDWRYLEEFAAVRQNASVEDLRISHFVAGMVGRPLYMAIGSHDNRVGTHNACQFYLDLITAGEKQKIDTGIIDFYITADPDHSLGLAGYLNGAAFLLKHYAPRSQFILNA